MSPAFPYLHIFQIRAQKTRGPVLPSPGKQAFYTTAERGARTQPHSYRAVELAMDAVRSALAVHRSRVTELLRAWDKDVDTVDFRTFSRALALLDLKVDPQDALALFDEFEPEEGSVSLDDLEYKLRVNAGLLKEGAAEAVPPIPPPLVLLDPASDEPMAEQLGRALGASEPRSRLCALLRDWDVGGTGTIEAADFRQAPAG